MRRAEDRIGAIVQARMDSRRLHGKVLMDVGGRPILGHVIDRLRRSAMLDGIVVATSSTPVDDVIEAFCRAEGVPCYRGDRDHVARRVLEAAEQFRFDVVARVCADSPLYDWRLLEVAIARFDTSNCQVVTNVCPRTWPQGQSVEVFETIVLRDAVECMTDPLDREHVTRYIYRFGERFRLDNMLAEQDHAHIRLVVDTVSDLERMNALFEAMDGDPCTYTLPQILDLEHDLMQVAAV